MNSFFNTFVFKYLLPQPLQHFLLKRKVKSLLEEAKAFGLKPLVIPEDNSNENERC